MPLILLEMSQLKCCKRVIRWALVKNNGEVIWHVGSRELAIEMSKAGEMKMNKASDVDGKVIRKHKENWGQDDRERVQK